MNTNEILRISDEADAHADAMDGLGKLNGATWRSVRETYFADKVLNLCANLCEGLATKVESRHGAQVANGCMACAVAIRKEITKT